MIFDLKTLSTWDEVVRKGLQSVLGDAYQRKIAENSEIIKYRDSEEEACELFAGKATRQQLVASVNREFLKSFKHFFAYHSCRPANTDSYYKKGIVPLSLPEAQQQFRELFRNHATEESIETTIEEVSTETRDGVVHVVLDDRIFIEGSGHYLIYGGEYQNCLAISLPGASECTRDLLKMNGKATVFVCLLPFSKVRKLLKHLVPHLMADHFFRIAHGRTDVQIIDFTIVMKRRIPPSAVVEHYSPVRIKDPFKQGRIWNDEIMGYEY